jgi:hypothetical protein
LNRSLGVAAAACVLATHAAVQACPLCHSELGAQVRAGIFGAHFLADLLAVLSPFPVLALAILGVRRLCTPR